ncbi:ATP-binding protein [Spirulina sp. CS-785/01]|uniref:hybrid sensor histidine kinase/response regulator n=1 Tax=Spirulina sp. CS-785/01 TaxID=3021716 RepID=UPI00232BEF50|nr:ATP-binding protein [Spirulina sp. CS-785/01]MDB9313490.1 ATP-binding protein [Spirulina sp. CS-785/01]
MPDSNPKIILVVEDQTSIGIEIRQTLQRLGYQVPNVIKSGGNAVEMAKEIKPDLVLMDILLQGEMDGIEAARIIWETLEIPHVFLTSYTDKNILERAKSISPFGYIVKPFEERDIYIAIEIALSRAQTELATRKSLQKERELNELKSRFVATVSHDFRTPLSTIIFSAGLLEKYGENWDHEKRKTHLQRIQNNVQQMSRLLDDILLVSGVEDQQLQFHPFPLNLEHFCQKIIQKVSKNSNQSINLCLEKVSTEINLDHKLLTLILENLLTNALKYSTGKPIFLHCKKDGQQVTLHIQDQGIGIPISDQDRIFESFHRGKNVGTISGTGLGLAIVKRSVELHKGKIELYSEEGTGTTFSVTLPII